MADVAVVKISQLKVLLGLTTTDFDAQLGLIIEMVVNNLRFKLGLSASDTFPTEMNFIAYEVCVKRFNRLKNEGMKSYSQEGESITFDDTDFDDYLADIEDWKRRNKVDKKTLGTLSFVNPFGYR
ncbi:phage head-tail connector protein [Ligilactobacillus equi]|uniref:Prophage protein n=1 Tax=Ligilactobacillus equi DPC 6820 TaxID=1392007 RepID=V7HY63_9LACO|nr:phage head-tail connector protein [Ligilactobacillus equi]ETA74158.1 prophage protein [Ligilactobacillus equi DPC 6820]